MPVDKRTLRIRVGEVVNSVLRLGNVALVRNDLLFDHRRPKLLEHAGARAVFDIGANIGQWGRSLRRHGWRGRILSYEPLPSAFIALQRVAGKDPLWDSFQVALGAEPGVATINVSEDTVYSSLLRLRSVATDANPRATYVHEEKVAVDTLDNVASDFNLPFGVKMDVQGFESRVMDGGENALRAACFLEVELSLVACYEGEPLYRDMLDRVAEYGFRLALVEPVWANPRTGEALQFNGLFLKT